MANIAILYTSGYGHTKELVAHAEMGIKNAGAQSQVFVLEELSNKLEELSNFTAMIFGTPTYMGNMSAQFQLFSEKTAGLWFERKWAGRIAGGFTVSGNPDGDKSNTLNGLITFALQHGMIWVGQEQLPEYALNSQYAPLDENCVNRIANFKGVVSMAKNEAPSAHNPPLGDRKSIELYSKRIAELANRLE